MVISDNEAYITTVFSGGVVAGATDVIGVSVGNCCFVIMKYVTATTATITRIAIINPAILEIPLIIDLFNIIHHV